VDNLIPVLGAFADPENRDATLSFKNRASVFRIDPDAARNPRPPFPHPVFSTRPSRIPDRDAAMLGTFACARYRFILEAATPLRLSAFAAATLRGGFGHVFKRSVCVWPPADCPRCLLKSTCAYPYVFETAPPPGSEKLRGLDQIPRPYVIEAPSGGRGLYRPGERLDFRLVLVGRAIGYLPYFIFTFRELGETGLGLDRGRFTVVEVQVEGPAGEQRIYSASEGVLRDTEAPSTAAELTDRCTALDGQADGEMPQRLAVDFLTPTQIRSGGAFCATVTCQDLVRALLRRLSSLCYFHCGCELEVDFKGLIEQAAAVRTVTSDLRWQEQDRFSTKQRQRIDMGGVMGRVVFEAERPEVLKPYLPLLAAGEWVHVGKGSVMGLGRYRVERQTPN
jgi:hypothetical protein